MIHNMLSFVVLVTLFVLLPIQSTYSATLPQPAQLFVELPDYCPTPDALAVAPDGSLTLTCPNYADGTKPGVIVKITKDRKIIKLTEVAGPSGQGKSHPMGLAYGPDGALYVNANQGKNCRVLRMVFEDDHLISTEVVASGMQGPNGLRYHDGALYVTLPTMPKIETGKNTGGIYRFKETDRDIQINNDRSDPHLIFTIDTQNPDKQFGLDGLAFNNEGRLLVGDFGDGIIYELMLDNDGRVTNDTEYVDLKTTGIDGMVFDGKGNLFVAGFSKNKVFKVDPERNISVVAEYPDNDGSNGELDQPVDLVIYDGKLVISNFDLMSEPTMINRSHSKPYTLSYFELTDID